MIDGKLQLSHLQIQDREYFENPVLTIEDLQDRWDHPRFKSLDKKRSLMISTFVTIEMVD